MRRRPRLLSTLAPVTLALLSALPLAHASITTQTSMQVRAPVPVPTPRPIPNVPAPRLDPTALFPMSSNMQDFAQASRDWRSVVGTTESPLAASQRRCVTGSTIGGDYWKAGFPQGLGAPGNCYLVTLAGRDLVSVPFRPTKRYLSLAARTDGPTNGTITLVPAAGGAPVATRSVAKGGHWYRVVFDTQGITANPLRLRVDGGSGVVSIDDVAWSDTPPPATKIDAPLFGFADLHTHPMANMAFGGGLLHGEAGGPMSRALRSCNGSHTPGVTPTIIMNNLEPGHSHSGWPDFKDWPKFRTTIHQQLHVDWIRRAWQGGLRLMVALAVNNQALGKYFGQVPSDRNDSVIALKQLDAIRGLVESSNFMEIARTPADARRIIHEGKLAVVLGAEVDFIGDCHQQCDVLREMGRPCTGARVGRPRDECAAGPEMLGGCNASVVANDLRALHAKGARHVFLVHHSDNDLSGAALYGDSFNIYTTWARGYALWPETSRSDGVLFSLAADNGGMKEGLGGMPTVNCTRTGRGPVAPPGHRMYPPGPHVNSKGLTSLGEAALLEAWKLDMVVDVDHMSQKAFMKALELARQKGASVVAGHTWPRAVRLGPGQTTDTHNHNGKLASENDKSNAQLALIKAVGGIMGVGSGPVDGGSASHVPNDCAGTSRSWIQGYVHTVTHLGRAALGTDMGLQPQLMPRFGAWACTGRNKGGAWHELDEVPTRPYALPAQADAQHFPVAYRTPMKTYWSSRFARSQTQGKTEAYDHEEKAFFQALVLVQANVDPNKADYTKADNWGHWVEGVKHFALGMRSNEDNPNCGFGNFGCGERRAAFLVSRGRPLGANEHARVKQLYPKLKRVWDKFQEIKRGYGEPLERSVAGNREFDFNIDGLAHYGMIPDMLQDAYNQLRGHSGGSVRDLGVLLRSAEDYIRAWENIEDARIP